MVSIGLDVGSTTLKCVVLDENENIIYHSYERHYSQIAEKTVHLLKTIQTELSVNEARICISGSAGLGLADQCRIPFSQEVYATRSAVNKYLPGSDVVIELGGEDAKILFLSGGLEVRMNGSCAGGTGAFIDQMATLLNVSADEMNELASKAETTYTIASRCGVFAKSDIQPLLNQGARKEDISASIFSAIVNQTLAGLAQGRPVKGKIVYLGGPLSFLPELRKRFDNTLHTHGICPENSLYFVALGAAVDPTGECYSLEELIDNIQKHENTGSYRSCPVLFDTEKDYQDFLQRHQKSNAIYRKLDNPDTKEIFIGIDAGSTTVKAVALDQDCAIIDSMYMSSNGNPIQPVHDFLTKIRTERKDLLIKAVSVTGYGEKIVRKAFNIDYGIVETMAHFYAAKHFQPEVDFIIDIGGQDIKCFKVRNGAIDNLFLNEACSSGCGSFLQTFAGALGYSIKDFAKIGLYAKHPVDLGSRCTVFMNSSVKQAQKDGASIEDISAGLSISVVKNALYKVIRAPGPEALGKNIVVQGGTFLNDAVLRAFEQELGTEVIRPDIAGLMGAYGAALYAKSKAVEASSVLTLQQLQNFHQEVRQVQCGLCTNHCKLSITSFGDGRKFIAGNRCERPIIGKKINHESENLYAYKRKLLDEYRNHGSSVSDSRGTIGLPMVLSNYDLLPFWAAFFQALRFRLIVSPQSSHELYIKGQGSIPSDTVCYPAKMVHGHIEYLMDQKPDAIFYPCLTYNYDEGLGDNHFNCPVVAYYPEVIKANLSRINQIDFIYDYLAIHVKKKFIGKMHEILCGHFGEISYKEVQKAAEIAYQELHEYRMKIREKGKQLISEARKKHQPIIVLAGRPYHVDEEICHEIDKLICSYHAVVVTEDAISQEKAYKKRGILNQWTYHARLYSAAEIVASSEDMNLVQLVSFGCGVDAITTDEVREILEEKGKIYTQLKIDEITNLGAVRIRLRSLFSAAGLEVETDD